MLKNYLGGDIFKAGLTSYLKKYTFSNAATEDLWNSFSGVGNFLMIIKGQFCLFLQKILCCGVCQGDSNEHPQNRFLWKIDKNIFQLSSYVIFWGW